MLGDPFHQGAFKPNIFSRLLALDPLVASDFIQLSEEFLVIIQRSGGFLGRCGGSSHIWNKGAGANGRWLHAVDGFNTKQVQALLQHFRSHFTKHKSCIFGYTFSTQYRAGLVEAMKGVGKIIEVLRQ